MNKNNKQSAYVGGQILGDIPKDVMKFLRVQPDESIIPSSKDAMKFLTECGYHKEKV